MAGGSLRVVEIVGLTPALAVRSDLTPALSDLIAFGAFAILRGRVALAVDVRITDLDGAADQEAAMRDADARLAGLAGRLAIYSNGAGGDGVFITSFEAPLPDPLDAAAVPALLESWR